MVQTGPMPRTLLEISHQARGLNIEHVQIKVWWHNRAVPPPWFNIVPQHSGRPNSIGNARETRWPQIIRMFYHSETRNQFYAVLPFLRGAELALFHGE